jgi:acetoacetate decarboxylase
MDRSEFCGYSAPRSTHPRTPRAVPLSNREYLDITYRTDPTALCRVVPGPLKVREPLVRYEVMRCPTPRD